ncbi:DUF4183 domain-containing protein [Paenibacillus sp. YN15]|uniref:DUF4183 domain-containing protein n=1 Tax=Paenibacillus sp. YN15 TaxID=1742774 RepID=UPI000DCBA0FC|nr:DUF4183 domain-containing protein [Paenibacillus sp. YN15]RAV02020.1 hypothetical protein DQG13_10885 [Paenibacillus sp. YN15]
MSACCSKRRRKKPLLAKRLPLRAAVSFYYAQSTGGKREFRNKDASPGFRSRIPAPRSYSYAHVYVDGLLQSPLTYRLRTGRLRFVSPTIPTAGANITIEFITIYPQTKPSSRPRKKKASSPPKPKRRPKKPCCCCCKKRKRITKR